MPLSRSPPRRDTPSAEMTTACENTPRRNPYCIKRKRSEDISAELQSFMTEMRNLFADFKTEQDTKFNKMYSKMEEVLKHNSELMTSVEFLSNTCDSFKTQIEKLESERFDNLQQIQSLENKVESYERQTRATCIEIKNIPQTKTETKENLIKIVINISKKINMNLQPQDFKDIFRINSRGEPDRKTIIVDLTSVILKEKLIKMYKKHNKLQSLNTELLQLGGTSKPIYISENLTSKMKKVFYLARDYAKTNDFRYCWITNGKVFLRRREGEKYIRINDEIGLRKLTESA